jgi:hypothetical protein
MIGVLAFSTFAGAGIVGYNFAPDGDGVFEMPGGPVTCSLESPIPECDVNITGFLQEVLAEPNVGHLLGTIYANNPEDPTINVNTVLTNEDSFTWTSMTVDVAISGTITSVPVLTLLSVSPANWTPAIVSPITWNGTLNRYEATIQYTAGTPSPPVSGTPAPANDLAFGYKLSFSGSTTYQFTQTMTPVPEPGTLALVAFGVIGLIVVRRRFV